MTVHGHAVVMLIDDPSEIAKADSPKGKPYLHLVFDDGTTIAISTNLAEMIGGAGAGLRKRWEDRSAAIGEPKGRA
jgi:hypothetical protein